MTRKKPSEFSNKPAESHEAPTSALKAVYGPVPDARRSKKRDAPRRAWDLDGIFSSVVNNLENLLGPVKGYASLIQDDNDEDSNTKRWVDKIVMNAVKMEEYFDTLNMYRINGATSIRETSWQQIMSFVIDKLSRVNLKGIPIEVTNDVRGPFVQRDELIKHVVHHIVMNAYESIDRTGKISLNVSEIDGNDGNRSFLVAVTDTGCGIPNEYWEIIWEPFFSTKHDHIGLGLPYVAAAAPILNMHTEVRSNDGGGTTVEIVLPEQGGEIETETSRR